MVLRNLDREYSTIEMSNSTVSARSGVPIHNSLSNSTSELSSFLGWDTSTLRTINSDLKTKNCFECDIEEKENMFIVLLMARQLFKHLNFYHSCVTSISYSTQYQLTESLKNILNCF